MKSIITIKQKNDKKARQRFRRKLNGILILLLILTALLAANGAVFLKESRTKSQPDSQPKPEPVAANAAEAKMEEPTEEEKPFLIIIDPGHGGADQGTASQKILEKDINLSIAKKVVRNLERDGLKIIMTREEDTRVRLDERVQMANGLEADLFVSIHCNYCKEDKSVKGLECYYQESATDGKALAESIAGAFEGADGIVNRGTRTGDFKVLRETKMPAALIEVGFLSNYKDRQQLIDETYQSLLAGKIADGILAQIDL